MTFEPGKPDYILEYYDEQELKRTNLSNIIRQMKEYYERRDYESIKKCSKYLSGFKNKANIRKELIVLDDYLKENGNNDKFYKLLELMLSHIETKEQKYIPINESFKELYESYQVDGGISFLDDNIDYLTGGIYPGTLCSIVGGPGSMKTTYAINICYNALKYGKNVCYVSLEETPMMLYAKLLSRVSTEAIPPGIEVEKIIKKELNDKEKEYLYNKVIPYLEELPGILYFIGETDLSGYSTFDIEGKLTEINDMIKIKSIEKDNHISNEIDIVVVDHIQLLKYVNNDDNKDELRVLNMYVSFFRRQSLSFLNTKRPVSVILLSQVNREGIAYAVKHNGNYMISHVAEASELERASTYIISLYSDAETQVTKQIKIGALKLRNAQLPTTTSATRAEGKYYMIGNPLPKESNYKKVDILQDDESSIKEKENDKFDPGILDMLDIS